MESERAQRLKRSLTFSDEVRSTTATINRLCGRRPDRSRLFFDGHVSGMKNLVYGKAVDMAQLCNAIRRGDRELRLVALARLRDEAYNYQGLEMPFNTRRILLALIKETIKSRGDLLQQHRYIAAFNHALSGRAYIIRTMLCELGLAEVPEEGRAARAWDDHVYDNAGPGRKTPSQLVLDAYIKGLSRLTIVYEDFRELEPLVEAVEAGAIMGISVTLGLECIVAARGGRRLHHVLLLRGCSSPQELDELLSSASFKALLKTLQPNYSEQDRIYAKLVREFNEKSLPLINEGFESSEGELAALTLESLREQARGRPLYRVHLGQLLSLRLAKLYEARRRLKPEAERLDTLPVAELRRRYFEPVSKGMLEGGDFVKAGKLYQAVAEIEAEFGDRRVAVAFTRSLEAGLEACVSHLIENAGNIDAIEIWNNRVRQANYPEEARFLESLRRALNSGDSGSAAALLASRGLEAPAPGAIEAAAAIWRLSPLEARVGSDSDGYNHLAPGMGFAPRRDLRNWRAIMKSNKSSPLPVTLALPDRHGEPCESVVIPLGKDRGAPPARLPAVEGTPELVLRWRDLGRSIRNALRMLAGALLALGSGLALSLASGFPMAFGLFAIAAWFLVTYTRNFIVDEIARHGLHPARWRIGSFDRTNAANSVFFTFMSIPLLRFVEQLLDRFVLSGGLASDIGGGDMALRLIRFVPLALVNGCYIYCHNSLRGFTRSVKRANFFRSAFSFPLAIGLSYLNPWGALIPGALVNKVASDIVGGFTESSFKIRRETRRARQMYAALLPLLAEEAGNKHERYRQRLAILDVLYVWGNSPRGQDALKREIEKDPRRKAIWASLDSLVRRYEVFVKLITSKTQWRRPQRVKLEFLRLAAAFSYWLEKSRPTED